MCVCWQERGCVATDPKYVLFIQLYKLEMEPFQPTLGLSTYL